MHMKLIQALFKQKRFSSLPFSSLGAMIFRTALFGAGASLAIFIVYKYATTLHATTGLYAFLFPLSSLLAAAGITLAIKPRMSCDCTVAMRSGGGAIAVLWMATGAMCLPHIGHMAMSSVPGALSAAFHMTTHHFFLPAVILLFAFAPNWMAYKLGVAPVSTS